VRPGPLTSVYKNMARGVVALVFRCHVTSGMPTINDEVSHIRWLPPERSQEHMTDAYATRLLDALDLSAPAIREHDGTFLIPAEQAI